ncbi:hypothetical protein WMF30_01650 [Sorangium sp. So ce134]
MALLDSLRDASADRNVPLHLLLGLVSLARRLDPLLDAPDAPEPPPGTAASPGAASPGGTAADARGDALIYLLLGAISVRRTLLAELAPLRDARREEARRAEARREDRRAPDPAAAGRGLRSLLR